MAEHARRRLGLVVVILGALGLILVARLIVVQVVLGDQYYDWGLAVRVHDLRMPEPPRGAIRDVNGLLLAGNRVHYAVEVSFGPATDRMQVVDQLSAVLQRPRDEVSRTVDSAAYWAVVERYATPEQARAIEELRLAGVDVMPGWTRAYPQGALTAHVLGFVSRGGNEGYYGLEGFYDRALRATPIEWTGETDPTRREPLPFVEGMIGPPLPGIDLELSLDLRMQAIAYEELVRGMEEFQAEKGLIIVMDPRTGAILAMVSIPSYDPERYLEYLDNDTLFGNPAIGFQYEPGSVFKIITMAAGLDSGVVTPSTTYVDTGSIEVGGLVTRNASRQAYGTQSMQDMMIRSLNVGAVWLSTRIGPDVFYRYVRAFGFGSLTGIDLQGEAAGAVRMVGDLDWYDSDLGTNSYGQGLAVTPIQMIAATAAIANEGRLMTPYVVERQVLPNGAVLTHRPTVRGQPITAQTAATMVEMLEQVVEDFLPRAQVPGYRIAGKTGTAQIPVPGGYDPRGTIATFVGFGPVEEPQLVFLVRLDRPQVSPWGAQTTTVIFSRLAARLFPLIGVAPGAE